MQVAACSASRPVWERLYAIDQMPATGRVWASFERACYLELADSGLIALVLPGVGAGPLYVVIDADPGVLAAVGPGMPVHLAGRRLRVGTLEVDLEGARVWEPRPDWDSLRPHLAGIAGRLPLVLTLALACAPEGSLLLLLAAPGANPSDDSVHGAFLARAREAAECLRSGWGNGWESDGWMGTCSEESLDRLRAGAAQLAGLGGGLTPAGDDFLTGAMLWAWLAHPAPDDYCEALLSASLVQTTMLSTALLRAAARGECSASWHDMLAALAGGSDADLAQAVQNVVAHGHTSGADALAGFLWMESA
jgi:hypothetical protein